MDPRTPEEALGRLRAAAAAAGEILGRPFRAAGRFMAPVTGPVGRFFGVLFKPLGWAFNAFFFVFDLVTGAIGKAWALLTDRLGALRRRVLASRGARAIASFFAWLGERREALAERLAFAMEALGNRLSAAARRVWGAFLRPARAAGRLALRVDRVLRRALRAAGRAIGGPLGLVWGAFASVAGPPVARALGRLTAPFRALWARLRGPLGAIARPLARAWAPVKRRLPPVPAWVRSWPAWAGAAGTIALVAFVVRHRPADVADPFLPQPVKLEENIEIQFGEVTMQGRDHGVPRWAIVAPKVSLSRDGRYTTFEPDPKGKFMNLKDWSAQAEASASPQPEASPRSMLWEAKRAQFDGFTEDLVMEGKAVITTDKKDVIKTEKVEYRAREQHVVMPKPVDIKTADGMSITGDTLDADAQAERMEIKGHVVLDTPLRGDNAL